MRKAPETKKKNSKPFAPTMPAHNVLAPLPRLANPLPTSQQPPLASALPANNKSSHRATQSTSPSRFPLLFLDAEKKKQQAEGKRARMICKHLLAHLREERNKTKQKLGARGGGTAANSDGECKRESKG